jgi:hypothetical protein
MVNRQITANEKSRFHTDDLVKYDEEDWLNSMTKRRLVNGGRGVTDIAESGKLQLT